MMQKCHMYIINFICTEKILKNFMRTQYNKYNFCAEIKSKKYIKIKYIKIKII